MSPDLDGNFPNPSGPNRRMDPLPTTRHSTVGTAFYHPVRDALGHLISSGTLATVWFLAMYVVAGGSVRAIGTECAGSCVLGRVAGGLGWFAVGICCYYVLLFALAAYNRRTRERAVVLAPTAAEVGYTDIEAPLVVIVVPARNEEVVIARTVERAQSLAGEPLLLVMDDGSDDATAAVAWDAADRDRTIVFSRDVAVAGRGKGDVLNAAIGVIEGLLEIDDPRLRGHDATSIVVCILDADGWLDPNAIEQVAPLFHDPRVGGVQVSVRMWNARAGFLARMQDIEFVAYGHLFQGARDQIGSVLMGGNGQFMRLAALQGLGPDPWTSCLTEDLEIGLRLARNGWRLRACPTAFVAQQALVDPRRFVRQRTRWVQGHLSCWTHLGSLWRPSAQLTLQARADLTLHLLLGAYGVLALLQVVTVVALALGFASWDGLFELHAPLGSTMVFLVLALTPIVFVGHTYQRHAEARLPLTMLTGVMVLYTVYHYLWSMPATALALGRIALRRNGWAKTARSAISSHDLAADARLTGGAT
ncbi:MAG: glycosyl transferase family 2 [Thermoleophilia bacterium]|nr:glycosyl transferase family 2 [Thermoleophilia bacterium]